MTGVGRRASQQARAIALRGAAAISFDGRAATAPTSPAGGGACLSPLVGILVGSESDRERMQAAIDELDARGIAREFEVRSAHRDPDAVAEYAKTARERGLRVLICGAGLAAALPGVVAAHTDLPVIGVPLRSSKSVLDGLDALLSIVQMPPGVPVACVGVDNAKNAAVLAARILGAASEPLATALDWPVIARYSRPDMAEVWSDESKLARWLEVELAALDGVGRARGRSRARRRRRSARAARRADAGAGRRDRARRPTTTSPPSSTPSREQLGDGGALAPLRPDLVGRGRHRARAADPRRGRAPARRASTARSARSSARAEEHRHDDLHRPHARRPRRADDLRAEARRLGVRARPRPRAAAPRARGGARRASSPAPSARTRRPTRSSSGSPASGSASSRSRSRRRSSRATGMRSSCRRSPSSRRRSTGSRSRSATSRAPRCARSQEPFGKGQKGSSAMPHKRNPITAERICGLARVVRANAQVGLENVALWHERDISHSSAERVVLPDAFLALDYMLDRFAWLVEGLVVLPRADAREPGGEPRALLLASGCCSRSSSRGLPRDEAYRLVQRARAARLGRGPRLPRARRGRPADRRPRSTSTPSSTSARTRATSTPSSTACTPSTEGGAVHV